jgi:hypothetical protein
MVLSETHSAASRFVKRQERDDKEQGLAAEGSNTKEHIKETMI